MTAKPTPSTARAAVFGLDGDLHRVVEIDLDAPGAGQVVVRMKACGVCHSDLNVIDGTSTVPLPVVLGHEGAGIVEQVGPGVSSVSVGDHVALAWVAPCGSCVTCGRGLSHLCATFWPAAAEGALSDGSVRMSVEGRPVHHWLFLSAFSERVVVSARSCVPIPHETPFEVAALVGCAVATGVGAVWRTVNVRPADRVAVFGCGGVGLSAVMAAAAAGAAPIVAVDVRAEKAEAALTFGATHAVVAGASPEETVERIHDAVGAGVDFAFEATGSPLAAATAFLSTRERGTTVCIGIPRDGAMIVLPHLSFPTTERRIIGSLYGSARPDRDFPLILEQYRLGRLPLDRLISHRLPLSRIDEAFDLLRSGSALRSIVEFG